MSSDEPNYIQHIAREKRNLYELISFNGIFVLFTLETVFTIGYVCTMLDQPPIYFPRFTYTISILGFIPHVCNILCMCYNWYNNFRYRNLFLWIPQQKGSTLYFIILPLLVVSIVYSFILAIYVWEISYCEGYGKMFYAISCIILSILILLFLIDVSSSVEFGEERSLSYWNFVTISLIETTLLHFLILQVAISQVTFYLNNINQNFTIELCGPRPGSFGWRITRNYNTLTPFMMKIFVIFTIFTILYFLKPLRHHYFHLTKFRTEREDGHSSTEIPPASFSVSTMILLTSVSSAMLVILIFVIIQLYKSLAYHIMTVIINAVSVILMIWQLKVFVFLPNFNSNTNIVQGFIFIGSFGKGIENIGDFESAVHEAYFYGEKTQLINVAEYAIKLVATALANVLLLQYSRKKLENPKCLLLLISSLYLLIVNNSALFEDLYSLTSQRPFNDFFRIYYFVGALKNFGMAFGFLFRLITDYVVISFFVINLLKK